MTNGIAIKPREFHAPGWKVLQDAAVASGAFPLALTPQVLVRGDREAYASRFHGVAPLWPVGTDDPYRLLCVDGGVVDNEPMGLARAILQRHADSGHKDVRGANHALILVDAFPNSPNTVDLSHQQFDLIWLGRRLVSSVLNQTRFKYDELYPAEDPNIYSRFMIAPLRRQYSDTGPPQEFALACGAIGGFGGFVERKFRLHDFHLGRRNCQRFLQRHFALPFCGLDSNPLFETWPAVAKARYRIERKKGSFDVPQPVDDVDVFLPIIPLLGNAAKPLPTLPPWPTITTGQLDGLERGLTFRLEAIVRRLIDQHIGGWGSRRMASVAWWLKGRTLASGLMDSAKKDLTRADN